MADSCKYVFIEMAFCPVDLRLVVCIIGHNMSEYKYIFRYATVLLIYAYRINTIVVVVCVFSPIMSWRHKAKKTCLVD